MAVQRPTGESRVLRPHLGRHLRALLLGGVDQGLVQVHHEHQLPVAMQSVLVLPPQLLSLLPST